MIGGYADGGAGEGGRPKWRSVSLQGCPREVRLLLAGPYYFDVDMVNSLPNVARQLGRCTHVLWPCHCHGLGVSPSSGPRVGAGGAAPSEADTVGPRPPCACLFCE